MVWLIMICFAVKALYYNNVTSLRVADTKCFCGWNVDVLASVEFELAIFIPKFPPAESVIFSLFVSERFGNSLMQKFAANLNELLGDLHISMQTGILYIFKLRSSAIVQTQSIPFMLEIRLPIRPTRWRRVRRRISFVCFRNFMPGLANSSLSASSCV